MTQIASKPAILVTIRLSHYCERARWALDRVRLPYLEKAHVPLIHRMATLRHGGGTVPLLIHGSRRLIDSKAILDHAETHAPGEIYPSDRGLRLAVEAISARFDTELGQQTRRWSYSHLLDTPQLLNRLWAQDAPAMEAAIVPLISPIVRRLARKGYRVTPERARRSWERIQNVFRDVDERLSDGRPFLIGKQFTAADLTFAALSAPVLFPSEYGGVLPAYGELPTDMRQEIERLRATKAGQFGLRMYSQERAR